MYVCMILSLSVTCSASQVFGSPDTQLHLVNLLLDAKCDINAADSSGWTPLYQAASGGEIGILFNLQQIFCNHGNGIPMFSCTISLASKKYSLTSLQSRTKGFFSRYPIVTLLICTKYLASAKSYELKTVPLRTTGNVMLVSSNVEKKILKKSMSMILFGLWSTVNLGGLYSKSCLKRPLS